MQLLPNFGKRKNDFSSQQNKSSYPGACERPGFKMLHYSRKYYVILQPDCKYLKLKNSWKTWIFVLFDLFSLIKHNFSAKNELILSDNFIDCFRKSTIYSSQKHVYQASSLPKSLFLAAAASGSKSHQTDYVVSNRAMKWGYLREMFEEVEKTRRMVLTCVNYEIQEIPCLMLTLSSSSFREVGDSATDYFFTPSQLRTSMTS